MIYCTGLAFVFILLNDFKLNIVACNLNFFLNNVIKISVHFKYYSLHVLRDAKTLRL